MTKEINVITDGANPVVTILEGKALTPRERKTIEISGTITAPADYAEIRKLNHETDHVQFCRSEMSIELHIQDANELGDTIVGQLALNPELAAFNINKENPLDPKRMATFLKMNKLWFSDKNKHFEIVGGLTNFQAKIQTEIAKESDTRGNKLESIGKKIETEIPLSFVLDMPIYVGQPSKKFNVEISIDYTDAGVKCWLESTELHEIATETRDEIINDVIARIKAVAEIPVIETN